MTTNSCSSSRDAVLRNQDKQSSGRTKTEINRSLQIDTEALSPQSALPSPSVSDLASKQVSTTEADSPVTRGHEHPSLSKDASSMRSATIATPSSPTKNQLLTEDQFSEVIAYNQGNPLSSSSTRSLHGHSHSPSIVNLGRRSVVRKRLAEIQHHSTSGTSTLRESRQPPPHTVLKHTACELPAANSHAARELADSGSLINVVGPPATTEQMMSPISSRVSPSPGGSDDRLTSPVSAASDHSTQSSRPKSAFRLRDEIRARHSTRLQRRGASKRSSSPLSDSSQVSSQADGTVGALLDVMDVHAERQLIKTGELSDQLEAVQNDVRNVGANVRVAILEHEQDSRHLAEIQTAVDDVRTILAHMDTKQCNNSPTETTIDERLRSNQAQIVQTLEEMHAMLKSSALNSTVNAGINPDPMAGGQLPASLPESHISASQFPDLMDIRQKLDILLEVSVPKLDLVSSNPPLGPQLDTSLVRLILSTTNQRKIY